MIRRVSIAAYHFASSDRVVDLICIIACLSLSLGSPAAFGDPQSVYPSGRSCGTATALGAIYFACERCHYRDEEPRQTPARVEQRIASNGNR